MFQNACHVIFGSLIQFSLFYWNKNTELDSQSKIPQIEETQLATIFVCFSKLEKEKIPTLLISISSCGKWLAIARILLQRGGVPRCRSELLVDRPRRSENTAERARSRVTGLGKLQVNSLLSNLSPCIFKCTVITRARTPGRPLTYRQI